MNLLKGFLIGAVLCTVVALGACNKPEPVVVAPVPTSTAATPATSTSSSTESTVVVTSTTVDAPKATPPAVTAPVKTAPKARKSGSSKAEVAAYREAYVNKIVYVCFERLYEALGPPTSDDIKGIDANRAGFAGKCVQMGAVEKADVKEFTDKQLGVASTKKVAGKKSTRATAPAKGAKTRKTPKTK